MVFLTKTARLAEFTYERTPIGALTLEQQQIMRRITAQVSGHRVKNEPPPTLGELLLDNISRLGLPINDDGLVTLEEWQEAISELGLRADQQETDAVFKAIAGGSDRCRPHRAAGPAVSRADGAQRRRRSAAASSCGRGSAWPGIWTAAHASPAATTRRRLSPRCCRSCAPSSTR